MTLILDAPQHRMPVPMAMKVPKVPPPWTITLPTCEMSSPPRRPYRRAPNPPKSAPDAIPTHMPIRKPIFTRSKQVGPCVPPPDGITAGIFRWGNELPGLPVKEEGGGELQDGSGINDDDVVHCKCLSMVSLKFYLQTESLGTASIIDYVASAPLAHRLHSRVSPRAHLPRAVIKWCHRWSLTLSGTLTTSPSKSLVMQIWHPSLEVSVSP